jgi:multiple sugar transport system substrate-binding protein
MKRFMAILLAAALSAGILAGCATNTTSSGTTTTGETTKAAESATTKAATTAATTAAATTASTGKKNLVLWYYWETESHQTALGEVIKQFNDSQSNITVQAKYVPFADFKKQLSIGTVSDALPDMVIIDNPDHAAYAAMGIFADLTGKIDLSQYYEGPVASCTLNGKLYGVPFGSNCLALFYNKDMLAAAKCAVPTTWDELATVAKKTTVGKVSGFGFSSLQNEEGTFNFLPWLNEAGTTAYKINNDAGIKAITYVSDLVKNGAMTKEVINWTQGDTMNQFISGNLAMMINGPWQVPTMREQAPNLNWGVALIPTDGANGVRATGLGGENFAIINNANQDASLAFIKFATSADEVKSYIDKFGYIASRKDVSSTQYAGDDVMQLFINAMQYAVARGPSAQWPEISDAISLAFNEAITGTSTPSAAAAKAQTTIDGITG